jgi:DNA-binding NtrC family response regulator
MSILAYYISLNAAAVKKARPAENADSALPLNHAEPAAALRALIGDAILPANELTAQAVREFAQMAVASPQLRFEESLPVIGPQFAELYVIEKNSENDATAQTSRASQPLSGVSLLANQEAVIQFFRSALGLLPNGAHDAAHVERFRRAHALAAEHGLTSVTLNRLFQRALWLYEKVRLETDFFHHAATVDEVLLEVAGKIFGGLKARAALLVGDHAALPGLAKTLERAGIGQLYFAPAGAEKPEVANRLQLIASLPEATQLPFIDLLLLFDHAGREIFAPGYLQKLMAVRNQAPLLLADLTAAEPRGGMEKIYNLFYFRRRDLEGMVAQNAPARRQADAEVAAWIREEVQQFYRWLNSEDRFHFGSMVGRSRQMQQVFELIARIAQTDITVLIEGESGTGKELVARAIHQSSGRAQRPFIAVNCGALPENLLESELFGHVRGAFTGAVSHKPGLFEEVNGGTIFLDEIGEMSAALQVKLLRFLQDGEIKRVGSNAVLKVDVRVLAATNRHLQKLVHEGKFRSDLYYRLNVIGMQLPALRDRPEDIEILAQHFLRKFAGRMRKPVATLSPAALRQLRQYAWPGNVRELENVLERAVALTGSATIDVIDLPAPLHEPARSANGAARLPLKEIERQYILDTVTACNDNYDEAARVLGIGRTTLWRKLKNYLEATGDFE